MEVIAFVCALLALLFGLGWIGARKKYRSLNQALNGRVERAEEVIKSRTAEIERLHQQAATDGNRLSDLRSQNRDLVKRKDQVAATNEGLANRNSELLNQLHEKNAKLLSAEAKIAELQPLADKAIAYHRQRVEASRKAAANRTAKSKANGKAPAKSKRRAK